MNMNSEHNTLAYSQDGRCAQSVCVGFIDAPVYGVAWVFMSVLEYYVRLYVRQTYVLCVMKGMRWRNGTQAQEEEVSSWQPNSPALSRKQQFLYLGTSTTYESVCVCACANQTVIDFVHSAHSHRHYLSRERFQMAKMDSAYVWARHCTETDRWHTMCWLFGTLSRKISIHVTAAVCQRRRRRLLRRFIGPAVVLECMTVLKRTEYAHTVSRYGTICW